MSSHFAGRLSRVTAPVRAAPGLAALDAGLSHAGDAMTMAFLFRATYFLTLTLFRDKASPD